MVISLVLNLINAVVTLALMTRIFRAEDGSFSQEKGTKALRFFTNLSNIFSAIACLILAVCEIILLSRGQGIDQLPYWAVLVKYLGTSSVFVTFLTVMAFLGPIYTYKAMLEKTGAWVHAAGPLLAIISFCFFEKVYRFGFTPAWTGILPMLFYGIFYLYRVVYQTEERGGWPDFYSFNKGGKWPISFTAMVLGTALICVILTVLHNIGL
ncbi:MAG: hypothetical protein J6P72_01525 [Firmicutes bacterium]|nr:hypothetical protein [Bacillota bacterium]